MRNYSGQVTKIQTDPGGGNGAWITCPAGAIPGPGQYLLATDQEAILATPLFAGQSTSGGFLATPPIPERWTPGSVLRLRGPLGQGFNLPETVKRLALVAVGDTISRLAHVAIQMLRVDVEIALFTDAPLGSLPTAIEVNPLHILPDSLSWPDFMALDLSVERLPNLRTILGLATEQRLACPAQALISTPMPCAGLADCSICAVRGKRSWKLACKDGPVFNLNELVW